MRRVLLAALMTLPLLGCGSDGGGVASTPAPTATPTPTPTPNANITDLRTSQTFVSDAAKTDLTINLTSKTGVSGTATAAAPLTVRYDAATSSYAITGGGITDTFSPSDIVSSSQGETRYVQRTTANSTYLTLLTTPYTGTKSNQYVALGYLQHNSVSGDRQTTAFTTFSFGLDSPASGIPRIGTGTFNTDVFGLETVPGAEPAVFQGRGRFDVDFLNALFSTQTYLTRTGLISGQGIVGGGIDLNGGGRLSAADGTFSGEVVYRSNAVQLGGTLAGRFYGPNADEIGASFGGSGADGSAFNGSLTGQRDTSLPAVNVSFAQLVTPQLFFGDATTLTVRTPRSGGAPIVSDYPGQLNLGAVSRATLNDNTSGNVSFGPPNSNLAGGDYTVTSIVSGDANFTSYLRTIGDQPTQLDLYKTGTTNKELALTYASFGRYSTRIESDPLQSEVDRVYFVYGFNTPTGLFANRTGTASYAGVAYGTGADAAGALYDVTGSSNLLVDFSNQSLSGSLALIGKSASGTVDYGTFGLSGKTYTNLSQGSATIARAGGAAAGSALINFYGPSAEEAGGPFRIKVPDGPGANTLIDGVMIAKKQ